MNATETETREELFHRFRPLAESVAQKYLRGHAHLERSEAVNIAMAALWAATDRYLDDPTFVSYARTVIRRDLCEHNAFVLGVSRHEAKAAQTLRVAIDELESRLGRVPRADEIASHMGVSAARFFMSFARFVGGSPATALCDHALAGDDVVRDKVDHGDLSSLLWRAVKQLPAPERALIEEHYSDGATFARMAGERGVSPAAVHHAVVRVLNNLRKTLTK